MSSTSVEAYLCNHNDFGGLMKHLEIYGPLMKH